MTTFVNAEDSDFVAGKSGSDDDLEYVICSLLLLVLNVWSYSVLKVSHLAVEQYIQHYHMHVF